MPRHAGHATLLAIATSAYSSYSSCRQYREDLARVLDATALAARRGTVTIDKVRQFFDHPGFVHAFTEGVTAAVRELIGDGIPAERIRVLFSTHSIPTADAQRSGPRDRDFGPGGAYAAQHEAVAGVVMANVVEARARSGRDRVGARLPVPLRSADAAVARARRVRRDRGAARARASRPS